MNAILDEIGLTLYRRRKAEESADEPDGAAQSSV